MKKIFLPNKSILSLEQFSRVIVLLACAMLLFFQVVCRRQSPPDQKEVEAQPGVSTHALVGGGETGDLFHSFLKHQQDGSTYNIQSTASRLLQQNDLVPFLKRLINEGDREARADAASVLAWVSDPSVLARVSKSDVRYKVLKKEFPDRLAGLSDDPYWRVRANAAFALGKLGSGDGAPARTLENLTEDKDPRVRAAATFALVEAGVKGAVPRIEARLADMIPDVRIVAANALGVLKSTDAVQLLLQAMHDQHPLVRSVTYRALQNMGPAAAEAVPNLIDAASRDYRNERVALEALVKIIGEMKQPLSDPEWIHALGERAGALAGHLRDTRRGLLSRGLSESLVRIAGWLGPEDRKRFIDDLELLDTRKDQNFRNLHFVLAGMSQPGPLRQRLLSKQNEQELLEKLDHEDSTVRRAAAIALAEGRPDTVIPALLKALSCPDPLAGLAAAQSLASFGKRSVDGLLMQLDNPDTLVRILACYGLARTWADERRPMADQKGIETLRVLAGDFEQPFELRQLAWCALNSILREPSQLCDPEIFLASLLDRMALPDEEPALNDHQ